MEIALVYREIQQLLIENEDVILPEVGRFAVVAKSATFLEDCKAILPPKKELLFSPSSEQGENDVFEPWQHELAEQIVLNLQQKGAFEVPGFGIFKQNEDGKVSFEVSPLFDFAPDSFSLEAIALEVMDPAPVQEPVNELEQVVAEETEAPREQEAEEATVESVEEPHLESVPEKHDVTHNAVQKQKWILWCAIALIIVLIVVLFVLLFKEPLAEALKNVLYSKEELEIIRQWQAQ